MSKNAAKRKRRQPSKHVASKVLVLCEGDGTEFRYFNAAKKELKVPNVAIGHQDNINDIVAFIDTADTKNNYNEIWCVVDHDEREENIRKLRSRINGISKRIKVLRSQGRKRHKLDTIKMIMSVPCFEYWLLIHFKDITRPFEGLHGNSACNQVTAQLKKHLQNYTKSDPLTYSICREHMNTAIARAKAKREPSHSSTTVWKLIERLRAMSA